MRATAAILCVLSAAAQAQPSCPTQPPQAYGTSLTMSCDPCLAGQPVTFTLAPLTQPCQLDPYQCPNPYAIQACDTVAWNVGDGSAITTVTGSPSATHTYAAGNGYEVTVEITNSLSQNPTPRTFEVTIGNSSPTTITISLPATISEAAPALVVNLTRSGNLSVPSDADYRLITYSGSPQRLASAEGEVHFAAGETQRVLSFPLLENDTVFMGTSPHIFTLESEDGTLLAGLPKVPFYPTKVRGQVDVIDDEPHPRVRLHDITIREGNAGFGYASIAATLDVPSGLYVGFSGKVSGVADDFYQGNGSAWFSFLPGQLAAEGTLMIKGDIEPEPDEALTFTLNDPGPTSNLPAIEDGTPTITILNDDIGFGQQYLWINVGDSATLPLDLGNPLPSGAKLTLIPDSADTLSVTPSVNVGQSAGTATFKGLRGGDAIVTARVETATNSAIGQIQVYVFQPSTLVADPAAVRLHVGEELPLRVAFQPAQPTPTPVTVQPEKGGVVAILNTTTDAPAAGQAVIRLRGLAIGKTTLFVYSPGQPTTLVPVEVIAGTGRRRAAKP